MAKEKFFYDRFQRNYITNSGLAFSDHDGSNEVQRANVLYTLRSILNLFAGQLEYAGNGDIVIDKGYAASTSDAYAYHGVLCTANRPSETNERHLIWRSERHPKAVVFRTPTTFELWVDALSYETYKLFLVEKPGVHLFNDSIEEVRAIIQDYSWEHYIGDELNAEIMRYLKTTHATDPKRCLLDNLQRPRFTSEQLKSAFWELAKAHQKTWSYTNGRWTPCNTVARETIFDVMDILRSAAGLLKKNG